MENKRIMPRYIKEEKIQEVIDTETGEISGIVVEKQFKVKVEAEGFFQVYSDITALYEIEKVSDIKVLLAIFELATYNTAELPMTIKQRRFISSKAKVSHVNLSKNTARLVEKGFIAYEEGTIYINPRVSWRGDMKKRRQLLSDQEFMSRFNVSL